MSTSGLRERLLGRRADPAPVHVLVLVDPGTPGAAHLRLPDGQVLASSVAAHAVREAGRLSGDVVRETSVTATVDRLASSLGERADVPLAVLDAAVVATGTSLGDVVADPAGYAVLLRAGSGEVVALRVPATARSAVGTALAGLLDRQPRTRVLDLLADACDEAGLAVLDRTDPALPVALARDAGELRTATASLAAVDEVTVRLRRAQRSDDGFGSTFLVRPVSRRLTPVMVARGVAPSTVTGMALVLGLLAALAYGLAATGTPTGWRVVGSLLLLASLVVDCVDGEVARSTRTVSPRGGWLDVGADRVKEYAVYAGLAAGGGGSLGLWWLAFTAMALLVTRHFVDFGFASATRPVTAPGATRRRVDPAEVTQPGGGGLVQAWSTRTTARPALKWAKRAVIMPVGERTLLLVVLAPLAGVRVTLVALLALGTVAAAWTTAGRLGRTVLADRPRAPGAAPAGSPGTAGSAGSPGSASSPQRWRLLRTTRWLWPALARAAEHAGVAGLVAWLAPSALPGAYAWLAVVAFGLYDGVYRQRLAGVGDRHRLLGRLPFGWPVRVALVLVVLVVAGPPGRAAGVVLAVAAGVLGVALLTSSGRFWWRSLPSTP